MILPLNCLRVYQDGKYEYKLLEDEAANRAALLFINHNIFSVYEELFYDRIREYSDMSVKELAVIYNIIPSTYNGSEEDTIKILRSAADVIASPDYMIPSFMDQRVIYGLIHNLKQNFHDRQDDQLPPEETVGDTIKDVIGKGLKEHPEDWDYDCDTFEEAMASFLELITNPNNYEDIFYDDVDCLFMDEFGIDEDTLARMPFAEFATMRAMTNEERAAEELKSKSIDRRYAERKIVESWLQEEQKKDIFSFMPYDSALRKSELELRMQLTPTAHLVTMLRDIKNGDVNTFRWVNFIWSESNELIQPEA